MKRSVSRAREEQQERQDQERQDQEGQSLNQRQEPSRLSREGKVEYWNAVIADWELSGLKQKDYCETRDILFSRFKSWRYRLSERKRRSSNSLLSGSTFVPISISSPKTSVVVNIPSGYSMSFSESIDPKKLAQILSVLREAG